jgi:PAS domain S-box-containing protein
MASAESAGRHYLITGEQNDLAPYFDAVAQVETHLDRAASLTSDNLRQRERVEALRRSIVAQLAVTPDAVAKRQSAGPDAAARLLQMDPINAIVTRLAEEERTLLEERALQRTETYRAALWIDSLMAIASLIAIGGFLVLLRRHLVRTEADGRTIAEQAERLQTTLQSIGDGVFVVDTTGRITDINPVAETLTGWHDGSAVGQPTETVFRAINEETRDPVGNPALRALHEGAVVGLASHTLLIARDGRERPIDDSAAPIRGKDGQVVGCVVVFRDVTERRAAEANLARAAERYRGLVDATAAIVSTSGSEGGFIAPQETWSEYTGQAWQQHQGLGWADAVHTDDRHRVLNAWRHSTQTLQILHVEYRLWHVQSQAYRHVEAWAAPLWNVHGAVREWIGMCVDVEDRVRLEQDRQRLVTIAENSTDFIATYDSELNLTWINPAGLAMLGLTDIGQTKRLTRQDLFLDDDWERLVDEFFPAVLKSGKGEIEVRLKRPNSDGETWMLYRVFALRDSRRKRIGYATISRDITERRATESNLRELAQALSEADRRKDEFLATLAHELRNPLGPIVNALHIMQMGGNEQTIGSATKILERQVGQLIRLVNDLLEVSRITSGKVELQSERVDLCDALEGAIDSSRLQCERLDHELTVSLPEQPVYVYADPIRVAQVVNNLLNNACKFTPSGNGRVSLTVTASDREATIEVKDNGIGIEPDQQQAIFEMFTQVDTSLERSQDGLGIGLALVKSLIEMQGGRVACRSEGAGLGSSFLVYLPVVADEAPAATDDARGYG